MNQFIRLTPSPERERDRGKRVDAVLVRASSITHFLDYETHVEIYNASLKNHWREWVKDRPEDFIESLPGFIKLTLDPMHYGNRSSLYVRTACITHAELLPGGRGGRKMTTLHFSADYQWSYHVSESLEEIYDLIKAAS